MRNYFDTAVDGVFYEPKRNVGLREYPELDVGPRRGGTRSFRLVRLARLGQDCMRGKDYFSLHCDLQSGS